MCENFISHSFDCHFVQYIRKRSTIWDFSALFVLESKPSRISLTIQYFHWPRYKQWFVYSHAKFWAASISKCLNTIVITIIKIRRSHNRLIFIMAIHVLGKTVFILKRDLCLEAESVPSAWRCNIYSSAERRWDWALKSRICSVNITSTLKNNVTRITQTEDLTVLREWGLSSYVFINIVQEPHRFPPAPGLRVMRAVYQYCSFVVNFETYT